MSKRFFSNGQAKELKKKYLSGISTIKLAEEYGASHVCVTNTLKRVGVKIRSLKDARKFVDITGNKNPNYGF